MSNILFVTHTQVLDSEVLVTRMTGICVAWFFFFFFFGTDTTKSSSSANSSLLFFVCIMYRHVDERQQSLSRLRHTQILKYPSTLLLFGLRHINFTHLRRIHLNFKPVFVPIFYFIHDNLLVFVFSYEISQSSQNYSIK